MFRTTRHKTLRIPHGIALITGLLALSAWLWTTQHLNHNQQSIAMHEEMTNTAVQNSGKALLDIGVLLLLRGTRD